MKRGSVSNSGENARRERILDAAEEAFANAGFEGASIRQIAAEARENLATVYYHFQSKEGLMEAVVRRRFGPLNRRHFELVNALKSENPDGAPTLEGLVRAMLSPGLHLAASGAPESAAVMRLIGRMLTEPNPAIQDLLRRQCEEVRTLYFDAFRLACPELQPDALRWRIETMWGALAFILCNARKLTTVGKGEPTACDADTILDHLVPFFSAGFAAPSKSAAAKARRAGKRATEAPLPLIE